MYNLQKPTARKLLSVFILLTAWCRAVYSQELKQSAPTLFKKCWSYSTNKLTDFEFASDNENGLYVALLDGKLMSVDLTSGEKRWETELGGEIVSAPLVETDNAYIVTGNISERNSESESKHNIETSPGNHTLTLRSLNKATGITRWKAEFTNGFSSIQKVYLFNFENYLVFAADNGDVYCVNKTNGQKVWKKNFRMKSSFKPFVKADQIVLGTLDNRIVHLSVYDGRLIGDLAAPVSFTTVVESANGNLILGDDKGSLRSFDKKLKAQHWKFRNGAKISNIILTRKGLLVTSFDNFVYLISEANGKLFWKKRLSGRIANEPQIYGNCLIVTAADDRFASVIELENGKLVNRIALEDDNFFSGESTEAGNYFIYATVKGIFSFSDADRDCVAHQ